MRKGNKNQTKRKGMLGSWGRNRLTFPVKTKLNQVLNFLTKFKIIKVLKRDIL